jgi:hypothetical protein
MNTDTPRTDEWLAEEKRNPRLSGLGNWIDYCKQLERELTAARAEITEWRILNGWGGTPEIINDFIKGQQTRIHHAQDLETELAAVTEQRDAARRLAEKYRNLSCESQEEADVTLLPWEGGADEPQG